MWSGFTWPDATVSGCLFEGNVALPQYQAAGGGLQADGRLSVSDCEFTGNVARWGGGAATDDTHDPITFMRCTFFGNFASRHGGGLSIEQPHGVPGAVREPGRRVIHAHVEDLVDDLRLLPSRCQEHGAPRRGQEGQRGGQPPRIEAGDPGREVPASVLGQGVGPREQRGGVPVVTDPEQDEPGGEPLITLQRFMRPAEGDE